MKPRAGILVALGALAAAVVVVGIATVNSGRARAPVAPAPSRAASQQTPIGKVQVGVKGLQLKDYDESGNLIWRVKSSGSMDFDRGKLIARGSDIDWELSRGGDSTLSVEAAEFVADYPDKQIRFAHGIQVNASTGELSFRCDGAAYDLDSETFSAQGKVNAQFRDFSLDAGTLGLDRLSSQVRATDDVVFTYADYVLKAGSAKVDTDKQTAVLTGEPNLKRGRYSVRADTVRVDAETENVNMDGKVRLRHGKLRARGNRARLDKRAGRAVLEGNVELSDDQVTARGPRLDIDESKTTATMTGEARCSLKFAL